MVWSSERVESGMGVALLLHVIERLERSISASIAGNKLDALFGGIEFFLATFYEAKSLLVAVQKLFKGKRPILHGCDNFRDPLHRGFKGLRFIFGFLCHGIQPNSNGSEYTIDPDIVQCVIVRGGVILQRLAWCRNGREV
jgi:hypothetical protein